MVKTMKINRLLEIVTLLMQQRDITVKELAERFEVSKKTIYRDLETLITSKIPVCYGEHMKGKVALLDGFTLNAKSNKSAGQTECPFKLDEVILDKSYSESQRTLKTDFIKHKPIDTSKVRGEILQSWYRCLQAGTSLFSFDAEHLVDPNQMDNYKITETETTDGQLFISILKHLNWNVALYDTDAQLKQILWINPVFENIGFIKDATEKAVGTNAVHTSLIENRMSYVVGSEHFKCIFNEYVSVAVPVYKNQEINGVLLVFFSLPITNEAVESIFSLARFYEKLVLSHDAVISELNMMPLLNYVGPAIDDSKLLGKSGNWVRLKRVAESLANTKQPILLKGDYGTGKRTLAKWIHANSNRRNGPCQIVDCNDESVEENLFCSLLDASIGGTLILKDIHQLSPSGQKKLHQFITTGTCQRNGNRKKKIFDVRLLICMPIDYELEQYLKVEIELIQLYVPSLSERQEDISLIARTLLEQTIKDCGLRSFDFEGFYSSLERKTWDRNLVGLLSYIKKCKNSLMDLNFQSSEHVVEEFVKLMDTSSQIS